VLPNHITDVKSRINVPAGTVRFNNGSGRWIVRSNAGKPLFIIEINNAINVDDYSSK
jgi:hypothetical protein